MCILCDFKGSIGAAFCIQFESAFSMIHQIDAICKSESIARRDLQNQIKGSLAGASQVAMAMELHEIAADAEFLIEIAYLVMEDPEISNIKRRLH